MNLFKIVDSVHSEFGIDLKQGSLLSNLTTACSLSIPNILSKSKLFNLVFLHSHLESNIGKQNASEEN